MDKTNLVEKIRGIAEKVAETEVLELVHVEFVGSGKKQTIRIYIDSEDGITHDHCSAVSHGVENILDAEDPILTAYTLEVSSPGIERVLYSISDFEKFKDGSAKIKTYTAVGNQKNFRGKIIGVDNEEIVFEDRTNGIVNIPHSIIRKAKLEYDMERELRQAKKRK